jgi:hypothetical protein
LGCDVVPENPAKLVVADFTDETCRPTQRSDARDGVGRRAPRYLDGRPHGVIQRHQRGRLNELHAALGRTEAGEERIIASADDIDDCVTNADDVEARSGHEGPAGLVRIASGL